MENRREFLKLTGLAGGGLVLGTLIGCSRDGSVQPDGVDTNTNAEAPPFIPNPYIQITADKITIFAPVPEIGQGARTALPMIVAEELDAAWDDVVVEIATVDSGQYVHQTAGGSRSIPTSWMPLRQAGATARNMLVQAAALRWEVDPGEVTTRDSAAIHTPTGRRLSYFELANAAAELPVPAVDEVTLKDVSDFRLLGKQRVKDVNARQIVTGESLFGIDKQLPDMVHASFIKCPAWGGRVQSANLAVIKELPGVLDAFIVEGNADVRELADGVAIIARNTWATFAARKSLAIVWDETDAAKDSTDDLRTTALELVKSEGSDLIVDKGSVESALKAADKRLSSFYEYAFVSHAQMEPQNTTAWWHDGIMEVWAPSQFPGRAATSIAQVLELEPDQVVVHSLRAGGGFGRRAINDPVVEAAVIAHRVSAPVKLTWTREDDMTHDFYRAGGFHALEGGVDAQGKLSAWRNHFVSITNDGTNPVIGGNITGDIDPGPFVDNYRITQTLMPWSTLCGPWRAPRSNVVAFAHQSFLHELSSAAGRDHVEFLLELLGEPRWLEEGNRRALDTGRAASVIKLAAKKAGWGAPLPDGHGLGIAFYFSHAGHIAEAAEVSLDENNQVKVHKVTAAVDVGPIVNLSGAENQVQGSIVDGLSTMLGQQITFVSGKVQETNFDTYPLLRLPRAPTQIDVHFIASDNPPTGLGEPALPPLAPAVGNAIFAATGKRVRRMPITHEGLT